MIESALEWLAGTSGSISLHESVYLWPAIESVHVLTLGLFVGFSAILDLRLLGVSFTGVPAGKLARRLLPWTTAGFAVMVVSGVLVFYGNPLHFYHNIFFRLKLVLLILAGINVWVFHRGVWRTIERWNTDAATPRAARFAGAASLVLWISIIFAGRLIAYNWFECKNTQIAAVRWASGCAAAAER
jgi:hypothetical protein